MLVNVNGVYYLCIIIITISELPILSKTLSVRVSLPPPNALAGLSQPPTPIPSPHPLSLSLSSKAVKHSKILPWLNLIQAMSDRDWLKKERMFTEYKTAHNKVLKISCQKCKQIIFMRLMENNKDISSVWRALNTFTKGTDSRQKENPHHFTAAAFNDYFLSIEETLVKSQDSPDSNKHYSCSKRLVDFCQQKTKGTDPFTIPLIAVHEMEKYISEMNNKKSSEPDEISNQLLKLASPYIAYIFKLCVEQNFSPSEFQKAKVIPLAKTWDHKNLNDYRSISLLSVLSKLPETHVHKYPVTYL